MKFILTYLFLGIISLSYGQDLRQEFVKMNAFLDALNNYQLNVTYSVQDTVETESGKVSVIVDPNGLFYDFGEAKMMINKTHTILVEDQSKTIIYSTNQKVKKRNSVLLSDYLLRGIDTLINTCDSITFYMHNSIRTYNLRFENAYFNLVQLEFDRSYLSKVIYYYNSDVIEQSGLSTICSVHIEENLDIAPYYFQTNYYIKERDGMMIPTAHFSNYLIIYNESIETFID